ncbi:SDR family NAD(P)-dependent oxidoreductase [Micromonospora sp. DT53]|uniref:SDR family NAD(P)-dependent oxidoreductase n=1 Tax=Micromonospora sp. DT53 TaxID=3393444 RepID=UPI003CFAA281
MNNAGVQNPATTIEFTDLALWDRTFAINVTGQLLGIKAVTPAMRRCGEPAA